MPILRENAGSGQNEELMHSLLYVGDYYFIARTLTYIW